MITIKYTLAAELTDAGTHTAEQSNIGPRNLRRLAARIEPLRKGLQQQYGNAGVCRIWLEINGREVDPVALDTLRPDDYAADLADFKRGKFSTAPITPTQRAVALIAEFAA